MKLPLAALCLGLACISHHAAAAEPWVFDSKIAVSGEPGSGIFHHLNGAGRKHIALAGDSVAVTWEDNSSGDPQVYIAFKSTRQQRFSQALRVSGGAEAYEPAIVGLPDNRFLLAWEQDAAINARIFGADGPGEPLRLAPASAGHVSLAAIAGRVYAVWRERRDGAWFVRVAALRTGDDDELKLESVSAVEPRGVEAELLFPSIAVNAAGICVAWEDRRAGHTRLLVSHSADEAKTFVEPRHLNEFFFNRNQYDQGNGVTRVSLASFARDEILAAWMDKRRGGLGYGIFAALGADGGEDFGPNEKVHGAEGDRQPHYNPAATGNEAGDFVTAWDDFRRGDSDIWISSYNEDDEWGRDFAPAPASGPGEQSHPAIALDEGGDLHLLWMERVAPDAPGRLWYSRGRRGIDE